MPILSVIGLLRQIVRVCLCQPARTATPPATPLVRHTSVSFRTLASLPRSLSTRPAAPLRVRQIPDLRSPLQNAKRMESIKEIPFRDILLTTEPFLLEITSHRLINSKRVIRDKSTIPLSLRGSWYEKYGIIGTNRVTAWVEMKDRFGDRSPRLV